MKKGSVDANSDCDGDEGIPCEAADGDGWYEEVKAFELAKLEYEFWFPFSYMEEDAGWPIRSSSTISSSSMSSIRPEIEDDRDRDWPTKASMKFDEEGVLPVGVGQA